MAIVNASTLGGQYLIITYEKFAKRDFRSSCHTHKGNHMRRDMLLFLTIIIMYVTIIS
jgi:hypothetical protein